MIDFSEYMYSLQTGLRTLLSYKYMLIIVIIIIIIIIVIIIITITMSIINLIINFN